MRILLFFDLPSITNTDKKIYRKFHTFLQHEGFIQMQESVYVKLTLNTSIAKAAIKKIQKEAPKQGSIQVLTITEKQYSQIEYITGERHTKQIESEERLIII